MGSDRRDPEGNSRKLFFFLQELSGALGSFGASCVLELAEDLHLRLSLAGFAGGAQSLREKEVSIRFRRVRFLGCLEIRDGFFIALQAHQGATAVQPSLDEIRTDGESFIDLRKSF